MLEAEEAYKLLFHDSLLAALIFPFDEETVFDVMVYFGGYDTTKMVVLGVLASAVGFIINYTIGSIIYRLRSFVCLGNEDEKKFQKIAMYGKKYGIYVLLLNFHFLFGPIGSLLAGMLNVKPLIFLAMIILGRGGYYAYFLSQNVTAL